MRTSRLAWTGFAPLAALALLALVALFFSTQIPARQPGSARTRQSEPHPDAADAQTP